MNAANILSINVGYEYERPAERYRKAKLFFPMAGSYTLLLVGLLEAGDVYPAFQKGHPGTGFFSLLGWPQLCWGAKQIWPLLNKDEQPAPISRRQIVEGAAGLAVAVSTYLAWTNWTCNIDC